MGQKDSLSVGVDGNDIVRSVARNSIGFLVMGVVSGDVGSQRPDNLNEWDMDKVGVVGGKCSDCGNYYYRPGIHTGILNKCTEKATPLVTTQSVAGRLKEECPCLVNYKCDADDDHRCTGPYDNPCKCEQSENPVNGVIVECLSGICNLAKLYEDAK